jgi:hypothetical protein
MGCGRVGSSLATELEAAGHTVSVIDQAREAFRRLGPDFKGEQLQVLALIAKSYLKPGFRVLMLLQLSVMEITQTFLPHALRAKPMVFKMLSHEFMIQDVRKFISVSEFQRLQPFCGLRIRFFADLCQKDHDLNGAMPQEWFNYARCTQTAIGMVVQFF